MFFKLFDKAFKVKKYNLLIICTQCIKVNVTRVLVNLNVILLMHQDFLPGDFYSLNVWV
jgi:hypothetical protein